MSELHCIPIDYDEMDLEMVRIDVRRLQQLDRRLGKAVVKRSSWDGWHVRFPDSRLSWEEAEQLMLYSQGHRGHIFFSMVVGDATLRVSKKKDAWAPYFVEVIEVE